VLRDKTRYNDKKTRRGGKKKREGEGESKPEAAGESKQDPKHKMSFEEARRQYTDYEK